MGNVNTLERHKKKKQAVCYVWALFELAVSPVIRNGFLTQSGLCFV